MGKKAPQDLAGLIRTQLAAQLEAQAREGKALQPGQWAVLIEARDREHTWPGRAECCADMTEAHGREIGTRQLYEWKRLGAPIPTKGPIYKADLWRWLAVDKRDKGRPVEGGGSASLRDRKLEAELDLMRAKLAEKSGSMLDAGEALAVVTTAVEHLRASLLQELPTRVVQIVQTATTEDAVDQIAELLAQTLAGISAAADRFQPVKA